jgi:hypothetical protein
MIKWWSQKGLSKFIKNFPHSFAVDCHDCSNFHEEKATSYQLTGWRVIKYSSIMIFEENWKNYFELLPFSNHSSFSTITEKFSNIHAILDFCFIARGGFVSYYPIPFQSQKRLDWSKNILKMSSDEMMPWTIILRLDNFKSENHNLQLKSIQLNPHKVSPKNHEFKSKIAKFKDQQLIVQNDEWIIEFSISIR